MLECCDREHFCTCSLNSFWLADNTSFCQLFQFSCIMFFFQGIPEPVTPTRGSTESLDLRSAVRRYSGIRHSPSNSLSVVPPPPRQRSASAAAALTATQESLRNAKDVISVAETQKRALVSDIEVRELTHEFKFKMNQIIHFHGVEQIWVNILGKWKKGRNILLPKSSA